MKLAMLKLPPLPRKLSFKKLKIECQQPLYNYKGDLTKSLQATQTSVEDNRQTTKDSASTLNQKRPISKKSDESATSVRIRDISNTTKNAKKPTSLNHQENYSDIPPKVTAKSWILYQMRQGRFLYGKRTKKTREMASLTKMMNLITILELLERFGLTGKSIMIKATKIASNIEGTNAQLKSGWHYYIQDLLYGMMLPSGNDAAFLLAQFGGYIIEKGGLKNQEEQMNSTIEARNGGFAYIFIKQMNAVAQRLGMTNSNFANPHGLNHTQNYSTAEDLAYLCSYSMKNYHFRRIVQTQRYQYTKKMFIKPKHNDEPTASSQTVESCQQVSGVWQNTNRMLGQGWSGIKTGITPNAGPCLAASFYKVLGGRQYQFLVVLLNSESMEARWKQVSSLVDWAIMTRLYF